MKLDAKSIRYLSPEDWRVLTAVEMGSKNHEVVPTPLITKLSNLRGGSGVHKSISTLAKIGLIAKVRNVKYDGYRLTYGGLDYLALHTHLRRNDVYSVGNQIGVGKESDIYVVAASSGVQHVLKIHRLGRISFRTVKTNRDYLRNRSSGSWMYMSRLAAMKEFAFMKILKEHGFPVPVPIAQSRHTVVMELIDAFPLRQITEVPDPAGLYAELISMILRLAEYGLIHGDFNEFNILIKEEEESEDIPTNPAASVTTPHNTTSPSPSPSPLPPRIPTRTRTLTPILIDFPQMISTSHANAEFYFDRDVRCIKRFFERRFGFVSTEPGPFFQDQDAIANRRNKGPAAKIKRLDVEVEASGFSRKMAKELETYMSAVGVDGDGARDESIVVDDDGPGQQKSDEEEEEEDEQEKGEKDHDTERVTTESPRNDDDDNHGNTLEHRDDSVDPDPPAPAAIIEPSALPMSTLRIDDKA
ncbi:MAG: hypothetical protein M1837_007112 [Sclerophora amabilis]|nr:MAG: hypothetical protein M1837_007112 [Sclerophora amabilis]